MNPKRPSPLVGYNTGVQHRGAPYHVQTEDSGIAYPHVITHVFAEGGRIVATRKTGYAEHVGTPAYPEVVRQIIRTQHADVLRALREGAYDGATGGASPVGDPRPRQLTRAERAPVAAGTPATTPPGAATTRPAEPARPPSPDAAPRPPRRVSLPGTDASAASIDELIIADVLAYLDE